jgi:cell division protease FtsH
MARKYAPAIIFIDELDAAGRKRGAGVGQGNDEREQTLNQLLVDMDGFGGDAGVVVMGATNRPDILDPALLRPGRFDRQVVIDVPDVHGRYEILTLHARGRTFTKDVDLMEIAKLCPGFSGAEIANLVNEAALLTVREGRREIDQATMEEAIDRVVAGPAKKSHVLSEDERWTIAVHEAGHAVATRAIGQAVSAQKLSIVARGRQLGTAAHMLTDRDAVMHGRSDLERQLVAILAGTAAELIEFGEESTGISDDLHAATRLARSMVTSFGMSPKLGHVTVGEPGGEVFLGNALQDLGSIGPETLNLIDDEVMRIVEEAEKRAEHTLRANWKTVQETASSLLEHETLSGVALDAVLSTVQPIDLHEVPLPDRNGRGPANRQLGRGEPDPR